MLFWIFVGVFVIMLVLVYLLRDTDIPLEISAIIATLLGAVIVISLCIMACNYIGIDAKVAGYQKRYEALTYQYENDFYNNDNGWFYTFAIPLGEFDGYDDMANIFKHISEYNFSKNNELEEIKPLSSDY